MSKTKIKSKTITISIELEKDILLSLALYAHDKNITLNDAINEILKRQLEYYTNNLQGEEHEN